MKTCCLSFVITVIFSWICCTAARHHFHTRIWGGFDVEIKAEPYIVRNYIQGPWLRKSSSCSGVIVSALTVLTSRRCLPDKKGYGLIVYGLEHDCIGCNDPDHAQRVSYELKHTLALSPIDKPGASLQPDIAIIALSKPIFLKKGVAKAVPITRELAMKGEEIFIAGYGLSGVGLTRKTAGALKGAFLEVVERGRPDEIIAVTPSPLKLANLTAGMCHFDEGGPVICNYGTTDQKLCGLLSHFDQDDCKGQTYIADLYYFQGFIEEVIKQNEVLHSKY